MKTTLMILALASPSPVTLASIATMSPTFAASIGMEGQRYAVDLGKVPTQHIHVRLPSAMAQRNWECEVTPETLSNDGTRIFRNFACSAGDTSVVVEAVCGRSTPDADLGLMEIRTPGEAFEFRISCQTKVIGGASL
jgi:hypothetical protein